MENIIWTESHSLVRTFSFSRARCRHQPQLADDVHERSYRRHRGFIATNDDVDVARRIRFLQNSIGAVPKPFDSCLSKRSLATLNLRMLQVRIPTLPALKNFDWAKKWSKLAFLNFDRLIFDQVTSDHQPLGSIHSFPSYFWLSNSHHGVTLELGIISWN